MFVRFQNFKPTTSNLLRSLSSRAMTSQPKPAFPSPTFNLTQSPNPEWKPRQSEVSNSSYPISSPFKVGSKDFKKIDPNSIEPGANYKLLINGVVPRPIAFVSSQDEKGVRNLAPFSYFSIVTHNPPIISISINAAGKDKKKDTASNILATKKFCVSIISAPFATSANYTSIDAPPSVSEWELSGLTPVPSETWGDENGPPRVGESPYTLECELYREVEITNDGGEKTASLILGRVKNYFIRSDILKSDNTIDPGHLLPISRGGGITYMTTKEGFQIPRPRWEEEKEKEEVKRGLQ